MQRRLLYISFFSFIFVILFIVVFRCCLDQVPHFPFSVCHIQQQQRQQYYAIYTIMYFHSMCHINEIGLVIHIS